MSPAAFLARSLAAAASGSVDSSAACFFVGGARASVYRLCRVPDGAWAPPELLAAVPEDAGPGFTWVVPFTAPAAEVAASRHIAALTNEGEGYLRFFDIDAGAPIGTQTQLNGQPVGGDYYPRLTRGSTGGADSAIDVPPLVLALFNHGVDVAQGLLGDGASEMKVAKTDYAPALVPAGDWLAQHKVHNAKVFSVGGRPEVFLNDLGNPFGGKAKEVPGRGLVHARAQVDGGTLAVQSIDHNTVVNLEALGDGWEATGFHARSSVQDPVIPELLYVLTQEVSSPTSSTRLVALMPESTVTGDDVKLRIVAVAKLPPRGECPGEGGADVIALGAGRVLVTDRFGNCAGQTGRMYQFEMSDPASGLSGGEGSQKWRRCAFGAEGSVCGDEVCVGATVAEEVCFLPLRGNPRFTMALRSTKSTNAGELFDVVSVSNNWGTAGHGDVTVFAGLLRRDAGDGALKVQPSDMWRTEQIAVADPLSVAFAREEDHFTARTLGSARSFGAGVRLI